MRCFWYVVILIARPSFNSMIFSSSCCNKEDRVNGSDPDHNWSPDQIRYWLIWIIRSYYDAGLWDCISFGRISWTETRIRVSWSGSMITKSLYEGEGGYRTPVQYCWEWDAHSRVPTHPLKYLILFLLNSRPWKCLKRGQVLGKSLNLVNCD